MSTTQWRLSARLARREVFRRPGRTVLVVLLVAVPVFCMVAGSALVRTNDAARNWTARSGTDIVVAQPFTDAVSLSAGIPEGAEVSAVVGSDRAPIVAGDGSVLRDVAIEDPAIRNRTKATRPGDMARQGVLLYGWNKNRNACDVKRNQKVRDRRRCNANSNGFACRRKLVTQKAKPGSIPMKICSGRNPRNDERIWRYTFQPDRDSAMLLSKQIT